MSDSSEGDSKSKWLHGFKALHRQAIPEHVEAFLKSGDPYSALQALRHCLNAEEAVPRPVADWLLGGILKALPLRDDKEHGEPVPLGVALGLEGGASGQGSARARYRNQKQRAQWVFEMRVLLRIGAEVREAAVLAEALLQGGRKKPPVSAESMERIWRDESQLPVQPGAFTWPLDRTDPVTLVEVQGVLARFPDDDRTRAVKAKVLAGWIAGGPILDT